MNLYNIVYNDLHSIVKNQEDYNSLVKYYDLDLDDDVEKNLHLLTRIQINKIQNEDMNLNLKQILEEDGNLNSANIQTRSQSRRAIKRPSRDTIEQEKIQIRKKQKLNNVTPTTPQPQLELQDPLEKLKTKGYMVGETKGECKVVWFPKSLRQRIENGNADEDVVNAVSQLWKQLLNTFDELCSRKSMLTNRIKYFLYRDKNLRALLKDDFKLIVDKFLNEKIKKYGETVYVIDTPDAKQLIRDIKTNPSNEEDLILAEWFENYIEQDKHYDDVVMINKTYFKDMFKQSNNIFIAYKYEGQSLKGTRSNKKIQYKYDICAFLFTDSVLPSLYPDKNGILAHLSLVCAHQHKRSGRIVTMIEDILRKQGVQKIILEAANENAYNVYKYFGYDNVTDSEGKDIMVEDEGKLMHLMEKKL